MNVKINNTSANLETLTYAQLKAMVPAVEEKLPSYKKLMEINPEILFTAEDGGMEITVYSNGCYTGVRGDYITVYSVDRCHKITYRFDDGSAVDVPESEYANGSWLMPLELIADHRLEHAEDSRNEYNCEFAMMTDGSETRAELSIPDFATQMEEQEIEELLEMLHQKRLGLLEDALADLTERQNQIVRMYFKENMTQVQIGKELGLGRTTVESALKGAIGRMKKFVEKNFAETTVI